MTRSAIVTGGSSGIGLAIARMLREEGFELTLVSRTASKIERAAAELDASPIAADVGDPEACARVVAEHRDRVGSLDMLVNSAGKGVPGTVETMPAKYFDMQLAVNLRGTFLLTQAAIPLLRESRGWIVNMSSISGTIPSPGSPPTGRPRRGSSRSPAR